MLVNSLISMIENKDYLLIVKTNTGKVLYEEGVDELEKILKLSHAIVSSISFRIKTVPDSLDQMFIVLTLVKGYGDD